jgi:hypothetical protein
MNIEDLIMRQCGGDTMKNKAVSGFIRFVILFMILLTPCLNGCTGKEPAANASRSGSTTVSKDIVFWGFFSNLRNFGRLEQMYGVKPDIITTFSDWKADFPPCAHIAAQGCMPLVVWEPWYAGNIDSIHLADITAGKWDSYIKKWGSAAASYGQPVMVRWGHEMNGNWYPWSGPRNGNNPELYIAAYRHVHDLVKGSGARNVIWVWCANATSVPEADFNKAERYYPGDKYVDWVSIDGYNWGTSNETSTWQSFDEIFGNSLRDLERYAPHKPVLMGEIACTSRGGDKKAWIQNFFSSVKTEYPNLRGWVWFNLNKETDWSFESDKETLAIFKAGLTDAVYSGHGKKLKTYHRSFR